MYEVKCHNLRTHEEVTLSVQYMDELWRLLADDSDSYRIEIVAVPRDAHKRPKKYRAGDIVRF